MDRARQYSTRLAVLSSSLTHWKKLPPLPSLTSQPHQVLASEPIPFSDLQQVSCPSSHHCPPTHTTQAVAEGLHSLPQRRRRSGVSLVVCGPPHFHLTLFNFLPIPSLHPLLFFSPLFFSFSLSHLCLSLWLTVPIFPPLWPSNPPLLVSGSPFSPVSLCSSLPWTLSLRSPG